MEGNFEKGKRVTGLTLENPGAIAACPDAAGLRATSIRDVPSYLGVGCGHVVEIQSGEPDREEVHTICNLRAKQAGVDARNASQEVVDTMVGRPGIYACSLEGAVVVVTDHRYEMMVLDEPQLRGH